MYVNMIDWNVTNKHGPLINAPHFYSSIFTLIQTTTNIFYVKCNKFKWIQFEQHDRWVFYNKCRLYYIRKGFLVASDIVTLLANLKDSLVLYISTMVWVLRTPHAGWNMHFQHFLCWKAKKKKNCSKKIVSLSLHQNTGRVLLSRPRSS